MRPTLVCLLLVLPSLAVAAETPEFPPEQLEFFEKQVRPLLLERCVKCHGSQQQKGNLRLDSRAGVLTGGDSGPAVHLPTPMESELLWAIRYEPSGYQMPPDGKLDDDQIAVLTKWVELGLPWPAESEVESTTNPRPWAEEFDRRRRHWSFQPLISESPPRVDGRDWCRTPIDRFILAKLEATGLQHAGEVDRRTWLRRVHFDVAGLPPTPDAIEAFLADTTAGAHERVIDDLLASPHFGERWGRHWLDLVRYAESRGHEFDYDVANPWPYRDYVIRALNADVAYDRFVVEHVAGDLLDEAGSVERRELNLQSTRGRPVEPNSLSPGPSPLDTRRGEVASLRLDPATGANESIVATGFWFLGEWVHSPVDIRQEEADRFENMIDVYSKTFLGLTVACARCHDHKFDPIPTSDFYALQGYLQSSIYQQVRFEHWEHNQRIARRLRLLEQQAAQQVLPVFLEVANETIEHFDQYLLAAAMVERSAAVGEEAMAQRSQQAAMLGLNVDRLTSWCDHLKSAAHDDRDPFHVWARFSTGQLADSSAVRAALTAPELTEVPNRELSDWLRTAESEHRLFTADQFRSDGIAYRAATGDSVLVDLGSNPKRPLNRIESGAHVEYVPALGELPLDPSAQHDGGKLGALERGGRTLRSPGFEITQDRIYCEIRGGCHSYVAVDSHSLINGPLHGTLLANHPVPQDQTAAWRWVAHDVSRYRGHRAQVELVPTRGQPFSVRRVVLAQTAPPQVTAPSLNAERLTHCPPGATLEDIASLYRDQWRLSDTVGSIELTEWVRQHPDLFGLDTDDAQRRLAAAASPLIAERKDLLGDLQRRSSLAPVMLDGSGEDEYIFIRGNWKKRGETAPRQFLSVFNRPGASSDERNDPPTSGPLLVAEDTTLNSPTGSGRLELAAEMVDPQRTPIVARVIVNRIWQHYFGRGIVPTPDDFGHLGTPPTHPELLDWLATEFIAHDWSQKHIHRLIVQSSAYRMRSASGDSAPDTPTSPQTVDPGNSLLWRMNVKRMEGEIIRDAILSLSGRLDDELYGRSIPVHLTTFLEGRGRPGQSGPVDGAGRRSLYIAVRRNFAEPFFQAFDFPNPHSTIGRRNVSNVPAQALALMNNPMVIEQCRVAADRLRTESPGESLDARVKRLYQRIYARDPDASEQQLARDFVAAQSAALGCDREDPRVWTDYVHALLNAKEFVFVR